VRLSWQSLCIAALMILSFVVRLYRIDEPLADWHAWRQADTAAVSRNFVQDGINVLYPRYDDISNIQTGFNNPEGYRFVEFPLYNAIHAFFVRQMPIFTIEVWGRLLTALVSTSAVLGIYLVGKRIMGTGGALAAGFAYGLLPYSIYYGRVILPDPHMTALVVWGSYAFFRAVENKSLFWWCLSALLSAAALLIKPFAAFFFPVYLAVAWRRWGRSIWKRWEIWTFGVAVLIPIALWRWWITQYPEGVPSFWWLLNGGDIRFTGAYFYWIFAERISKLILGYWGGVLLFLGVYVAFAQKGKSLLVGWVVSSLLYLVVIARGNVQHDYYQILLLPTISLLIGAGVDALMMRTQTLRERIVGVLCILLIAGASCAFGWYQVRDYFNINNPSISIAGEYVRQNTSEDALIVAPYGGDTTLLYALDRKGWPAMQNGLPQLARMGADYLLLINPSEGDRGIQKEYPLVHEQKEFMLFKLVQE